MIEGAHPLVQTLLGTLFTWGLTALGAGLVFVFQSGQRKILDGSLGFAAGVMTAASYWSLLAPAIEMAEQSGHYGDNGQWAFLPVAVGFTLGAFFVYGADVMLPDFIIHHGKRPKGKRPPGHWIGKGSLLGDENSFGVGTKDYIENDEDSLVPVVLTMQDDSRGVPNSRSLDHLPRQRRPQTDMNGANQRSNVSNENNFPDSNTMHTSINWRRIMLMIVAITVHNIPEGLAVGVGFGAIGKSKAATFENARNLAFGIGIQNFPEGLAVSLPLRGSGMSPLKCFWYGQLSGMVEPIAGLLGAFAVAVAEPVLPYALAFAAGAMIYVVVDDIIPEAQVCGNGKIASWGAIVGFVVMMSLDVGLG